MCVTAPARVLSVDGASALIDLEGVRRQASLLLRPEVRPGDWVIVGAGTVLRRLEAEEAEAVLEMLHSAQRSAAATADAAGGP